MKKGIFKIFFASFMATCCLALSAYGAEKDLTVDIDWDAFLSRHDMIWNKLPSKWWEAPFLGNGMLGLQVRKTAPNLIRLDVGRGDVQLHGDEVARIPIGHFEIRTKTGIKKGALRLHLRDAVLTGWIQCEADGTTALPPPIMIRMFVHAERDLIAAELSSDDMSSFDWKWVPEEAINPRRKARKLFKNFTPPEPPDISQSDGVNLCTQSLRPKGRTATAWTISTTGGKSELRVSVKHTVEDCAADAEAVDVLKSVEEMPFEELLRSHSEWWHRYYPESFVSIDDAYWEGFYWIQMYKLASATRENGMVIDNQGPWLQPTPWPGIWWNLNIQLSYWPVYTANRLELGESLSGALDRNIDQLILNVPEKYRSDSAGIGRSSCQDFRKNVAVPGRGKEVGDLLWACHNYWLQCRYSMDHKRTVQSFYPLLKRSVNFYLHFLEKDDRGVLHIPKTFSPEYGFEQGADTNYDLALLKWGLTAVIDIAERYHIQDPRLDEYKETLKNLTAYPQDENGMMIASKVPFAHGHRHFSHLLMFYPLYLENINTSGAKELAVKSVKHWHSLGSRKGYSWTGASLIMSSFGMGDEALQYLNGLKSFIRPNTLYRESGPVIETPLSAAQSIQNMLLQSWGGVIRVFPAMPEKWGNVSFHNLRTEGAFLVSAVRRDGVTQFIHIKSLTGEPCRVVCDIPGYVCKINGETRRLRRAKDGVVQLNLKEGETAIFTTLANLEDFAIKTDARILKEKSTFGMR